MTSSFQQNWFHFIRTSFAKDTGFPVFNRKVLPLIIWFYPPLWNNDVSLHNLLVPVVVIPTSPRLSKTEFVCKRYCVYTIGCFFVRKGKRKGKRGVLASRPGWAEAPKAGSVGCHAGLPAPETRPEGRTKAGPVGWLAGLAPSLQLGCGRAQDGSVGCLPGLPRWQAGPGRDGGRLPCTHRRLLLCPAGLAGLTGLGAFSPNGHILWPYIKRAFFPNVLTTFLALSLLHC